MSWEFSIRKYPFESIHFTVTLICFDMYIINVHENLYDRIWNKFCGVSVLYLLQTYTFGPNFLGSEQRCPNNGSE
jgi:hypothetical protein